MQPLSAWLEVSVRRSDLFVCHSLRVSLERNQLSIAILIILSRISFFCEVYNSRANIFDFWSSVEVAPSACLPSVTRTSAVSKSMLS